jgi:hypothetical protein
LITTTRTTVTVKHGGSTLRILAADAPSSYGLRPTMVICDEQAEWRTRALWDSLWSASGKRKGCRVVVITTAGWDRTSIAWEVRQIAEAEPNWLFSSRSQCASWIDPAWLQQQQRTLPAHVYARLHENRWVDGVGAFFSAEEIERIFTEPFPLNPGARAIGLDLGLSRDKTVISLLRDDAPTGCLCVDALVTHTPPVGRKVDLIEVEEGVRELAHTWGAPVVLDPWQAVLMAQRLRHAGIPVVEYTFTSETRRKLFGALMDLIRNNQLRCRPHPELRAELLGLDVQQGKSGNWRVDHKVGGHDDHVISLALAIGGFWSDAVAQDGAALEQLDANDYAIQGQVASFWGADPASVHPDFVPRDDGEMYPPSAAWQTQADGSRKYLWGGPS